jgi:Ca-activated chloride channel family protein
VSEQELAQVFAPRSAETGRPIELAMQRLWLVGRVTGVGARLLVRHVFQSKEEKPLEAIYGFVLPRDAALRRFRVTGQGFSVSSELMPVEKVRETYEEAVAEGHTAAMAAQYGDGMVNLTVGNIRPGEEVTVNLEVVAGVETRDDGLRFRFPFTLAPAYHARARAAEVAPGVGEIELPADEFGDLVLPQFVSDASALHEVGFDLSVSMARPIVEAASPSHAVRVVALGLGRSRVSLATAKDLPNRDLVLDVRTAEALDGAMAGTGADGRGHFAAVVPSSAFRRGAAEGADTEEPRRVVFVLDRSGSMEGAPITQAKNAVTACLGALGESDEFGIVAFDTSVETFTSALVKATMDQRKKAGGFLAGVDARGGTELAAAVAAAARMLAGPSGGDGSGGDVVVVTDGQVMSTEAILATARATGLRLHCLGIGSASQDRFLTLLARETGGVSRFVTPRERVDLSAVELFASVGRPLAGRLVARVEGFAGARIAPDVQTFVFAGAPVVVFGDTEGAGEGRLVIEWEAAGGRRSLEVPLKIGPGGEGETLRLLQGARLITDLESRIVGGDGVRSGVETRREAERIRKRLVALGEAYGLANREMGLVAVVRRAGDQPGDIPVTRVVPVGLAQDVMLGAYFPLMADSMCDLRTVHRSKKARGPMLASPMRAQTSLSGIFRKRGAWDVLLQESFMRGGGADDGLLKLASSLEPDGGLPGKTEEERAQATVLALLLFLAEGHSAKAGAFRAHVKRMIKFLEGSAVQNDVVKEVVSRAKKDRPLAGEWEKLQPGPDLWTEIRKAIEKDAGA